MPEVSIILPTYNRADTVGRAIGSILSQTFQDWELLVIDDGSTDATSAIDFEIDPRIRLLRQDNQGVAAARNSGLNASTGHLIAFLDSDDEWLPHFLELAVGFLKASPGEYYVTSEFLRDDTDHRMIKDAVVNDYLPAARMIGSHALDLPSGETDDYLRVYQGKQPLGSWASKCLSDADLRDAFLYQGHIFRHTRWGYFAWLPTTVLTRDALDVVGNFDTSRRSAEDYPFQALLSRHFRANFISVPSARKYVLGPHADPLKEDHLAAGSNAYAFRVNRLHYFDELHWNNNRNDHELSLVRRHYIYRTACLALRSGLRAESIIHFKETAGFHRHFWRSYFLRALAFCSVSGKMASVAYRALHRLSQAWRMA